MRRLGKRAVFGGFALLLVAAPADGQVRREAVTLDQLPPAARDAITREVKHHKIVGLNKETRDDGSIDYDVEFKTLTEGRVEAAVAPNGSFLGRWGRLEEPDGSGP